MTTPEPGPGTDGVEIGTSIDVVSDVVCPWCYIGKRQLEALIESLEPGERPSVRWHPFQLNPGLPTDGIDRGEYLRGKFGPQAVSSQIYARATAAGRAVGLAFDFEAIQRQPNTFDAHRLIAWADEPPRHAAERLVERLFRANFMEARFIGDRGVLAQLAGECGLDAAQALAFLESGQQVFETSDAEERARRLGVTGVPFFVFNQRVAVSGAQGVESLRAAWNQSLAR